MYHKGPFDTSVNPALPDSCRPLSIIWQPCVCSF